MDFQEAFVFYGFIMIAIVNVIAAMFIAPVLPELSAFYFLNAKIFLPVNLVFFVVGGLVGYLHERIL